MARRKRGDLVNGWLAVDKPLGMTSTQVVGAVRRIFNAQKAGHGGTLDPLATGVLPVALGEATKTVPYVMDGTKVYTFTVRWGEETTTDDREGAVIETSTKRPDRAAIEAALPAFLGDLSQVPPKFSAVKVDGQRAYDLARSGEDVQLTARIVRIDAFELVDQPDADHASFRVVAGKGTYIRSLARDLSRALGTVGHVAALRRVACGPFREEDAISLDKLNNLGHSAAPMEFLLPIETALDDIPALALTEEEARRLSSGLPVSLLRVATRTPLKTVAAGDTVCAMAEGRLVAVARIEGGEIRPVRVMNL
ncbi:MAG: pseudouridine synthase [Rhodospirillaceae bacterium BRH_c57]|nr:MAG: pseudouridine synthase [Rhodospirillaceae bacterium BRH_c57]